MFFISYPINKINVLLIETKVIYLGYGFKYIWINTILWKSDYFLLLVIENSVFIKVVKISNLKQFFDSVNLKSKVINIK